jgi:hypothetical protein
MDPTTHAITAFSTGLNPGTGVGHGRSLSAKVTAIEEAVDANDTLDACALLGSFISEVNAQIGKKVSATQAASFSTQAHDIEAALGC